MRKLLILALRRGDFLMALRVGGGSITLMELIDRLLTERDEAIREVERLKREIENLTPGGSEFHDNTERCLSFLRDRGEFTKKKVLELAAEKRRTAELLSPLDPKNSSK